MSCSIEKRLEQYTIRRSQEVLIVEAEIDGELDQIAIFKGYSSSLMRSTAFDPEVPVLPDTANIIAIDRLQGPYNPQAPVYIERGITWERMQILLTQFGI